MNLTLPHPNANVLKVPEYILPGRIRLAVLKTRQLFCHHDYKTTRKSNLFGNHFVQVDRCSKCKKRKVKTYNE